jgi:hypothetical protein
VQDDPTESTRRELAATINANVSIMAVIAGDSLTRKLIEAQQGQVWDADELARDFEVLDFARPLVVVRRKSDSAMGSLFFSHEPRFYWGFRAHLARLLASSR